MTARAASTPSRTTRAARLPASRKADLAAFVTEQGQVTVIDLAEHFGVSLDTIRRDLDELDSAGAVIRTHGGAVSTTLVPRSDTGLDVRTRLHTGAKERIGARAAAMVTDRASIVINGGTTTLAAVTQLRASGLRIITNHLLLPSAVSPSVADEIFLVGGQVQLSAQATTGPVSSSLGVDRASEFDVRCDLALIGVGAISATQGLSTGSIAEAALMRQMMQIADRVVVLADASKFGRSLFAQVATFDVVDVLVTDTTPPADVAKALTSAGVEVIVAS